MKTIIHVNQHIIKSNTYAHEAIIKDADGNEVAKVVYRPDKPLSCGAHVWIETQLDVETIKK
jgi:hypothetical protein